jgi:serine/threonine-protein kinase
MIGVSLGDSREEQEQRRRRVALLGRVLFVLTAFTWGAAAIILAAAGRGHEIVEPAYLIGVAAVLAMAAMWSLTASQRPPAFVVAVEASALLVAASAWSVSFHFVTVELANEWAAYFAGPSPAGYEQVALFTHISFAFVRLLILAHLMVLRAAFVPSTRRYTALLTAAVGLPIVVVPVVAYATFDGPRIAGGELAVGAIAALVWSVTTLACTAVSGIIYGLRREIRDARRVGQYTLEERLGQGGMGVVYRARHALLRRPTAVKLLTPENAGDEMAIARFEREVQHTAELTHPNTITIFDYGRTADGVFYYAMELLDGASLDTIVEATGPQPAGRVVHVLAQAAAALAEAHDKGLVHRDVKPPNIVLCARGGVPDVVKVLDFGLVKEVEGVKRSELSTAAHVITGTPLYMSPEAIERPGDVGPASDIYALGAVGYYMLTGKHVFDGESIVAVCGHHLLTPPEPPSSRIGAPVPGDLERLLLDCLAKPTDARPASASLLRNRLRACACAADWDETRAAAWWAEHHAVIAARLARPAVSATSRTALAIDLAARR